MMQINELKTTEKTVVNVMGEEVKVEGHDEIISTLKNLLEARGVDSFSLFIDGEEIRNTSQLYHADESTPKTFDEVGEVTVERSVKAGC